MKSTLLSQQAIIDALQGVLRVRGVDYFLWEMVAGDPYPLTIGSAGTYGADTTKTAVINLDTDSGPIFTSRFLPIIGPNTVDSLPHTITYISYLKPYASLGLTTSSLYLIGNGGFQAGIDITQNIGATSITPLATGTPTAALSPGNWYQIMFTLTPLTNTYQISYKLETATMWTNLGPSIPTGAGIAAAFQIVAQRNGNIADTGSVAYGATRVAWATTG